MHDVVINTSALDKIGEHVQQHAANHAYAVISDSNVAPLYGNQVVAGLKQGGARVHLFGIPAGEANKTVQRWEQLSYDMLNEGFGRDTTVIALGGGVVGDLAGFVAATFMRGVPVVQVPTTLLAMIDASIGGKTGVDSPAGKNLIGAFHQPRVVVIDPLVLRTLPEEELRYGLAEAFKHGAIADAAYFGWLSESLGTIFTHDPDTLTRLIVRSVEIKQHFVSADVHEHGARAALNFGHTIAHAVEKTSNYEVAHGSAVAVGMIVESIAGEVVGATERGVSAQLVDALNKAGFAVRLEGNADKILAAASTDKKARSGTKRYSLITRIGEVARTSDGEWTTPLPDDVVREALKTILV